ncbi:OsmC family protein [Salinisphaera hydrothermalis]|uniref:Peroxiredoxin osmC n=1 Tax=Salinisphaera hydrothermalis (strain C41B8) TaxID=1304275 RepID=A0A084IN40_SALHC|nr:OsmC family protein [Salinisphaera hydrothermalis]KEZ78124.1 peroxiredoxin osmC [Salinisphaera hydrothermalis C41B8]
MPVRKANAQWQGDLKSGKGNMALGSGAYEGQFSYKTRFEEGNGTNPEELLGAAHAGCFSMQFSAMLAADGHTPDSIQTEAKVHFSLDDTPTITQIDLICHGKVPGIDEETFRQTANKAKDACPVSRLFKGAEITLTAALDG